MATQRGFNWPMGQRAAVSLTYDDGLPCHHELVAPLLEKHDLRGTFNVQIETNAIEPYEKCTNFMANVEAWRKVAAAGHELGNHTVFHPCRSDAGQRRDWLNPAYNLCGYSASRWFTEMRVANFILRLVDGRSERTFANTCCDTTIGPCYQQESLEPIIARLFVAARGTHRQGAIRPGELNFAALGHGTGDDKTFEQLRDEAEEAITCGGWLIWMFHGVGPRDHRLHVKAEEHERLVHWLDENRNRIWTAPMIDVAKHLKQHA